MSAHEAPPAALSIDQLRALEQVLAAALKPRSDRLVWDDKTGNYLLQHQVKVEAKGGGAGRKVTWVTERTFRSQREIAKHFGVRL